MSKLLLKLKENRPLLADGAMGTELLARGFSGNLCSLNLNNPEIITEIHRNYIQAGAEIIYTNSFSSYDENLNTNKAAVDCARQASSEAFILGCLGSRGVISPYSADSYKAQANILLNNGVSGLVVETITNFDELKVIMNTLPELMNEIPLILSFSPQPKTNTLLNTTHEDFLSFLKDSPISVVGVNCVTGPLQATTFLKSLQSLNRPLLLKPNAGLPKKSATNWHYPIDAIEFCKQMGVNRELAHIFGGCCGTTPAYIAELSKNIIKS